jgi:hypothetical protein
MFTSGYDLAGDPPSWRPLKNTGFMDTVKEERNIKDPYMIKDYVNINMLDMINKNEHVIINRQNLTWECDQQSQPCENLGSGFISPEIYQR